MVDDPDDKEPAVRPVRKTVAPAAPRAIATPLPTPRLAPVTNATVPARARVNLSLFHRLARQLSPIASLQTAAAVTTRLRRDDRSLRRSWR